MTMASVPEIVANGVSGQNRLHEPAQIGTRGFQHEMQVIIHQAKHVYPHRVRAHALCQARIEQVAILIIPEYVLLRVPAHRHVIDCTGVFNSQ